MRAILYILVLIICPMANPMAGGMDGLNTTDAAYYAGETRDYIIQPPPRFRMVEREAADDGYSFAFVPDTAEYKQADILIGVNIFKIRGLDFKKVVADDTLALRAHYGDSLRLWEVDSVLIGSGDLAKTFYVDDKTRFIPNVMISYLNGSTELLIFELVIHPDVRRVAAEESFMACLQNTKALVRGDISER